MYDLYGVLAAKISHLHSAATWIKKGSSKCSGACPLLPRASTGRTEDVGREPLKVKGASEFCGFLVRTSSLLPLPIFITSMLPSALRLSNLFLYAFYTLAYFGYHRVGSRASVTSWTLLPSQLCTRSFISFSLKPSRLQPKFFILFYWASWKLQSDISKSTFPRYFTHLLELSFNIITAGMSKCTETVFPGLSGLSVPKLLLFQRSCPPSYLSHSFPWLFIQKWFSTPESIYKHCFKSLFWGAKL